MKCYGCYSVRFRGEKRYDVRRFENKFVCCFDGFDEFYEDGVYFEVL